MKLLLHWLRRDLRRHVPWLIVWALLVALFTWERVWFRRHGFDTINNRDGWLIVPAMVLGFAEVCLLLRVMLDDPARGPNPFWKTRPPSGNAVFVAKAVMMILISMVVPFAAEGVFLAIVGQSAGGWERAVCYGIPPLLALMAGASATGWRSVMVWLPVALVLLLAGIAGPRMAAYYFPLADFRLMIGAALAAAALTAWFVYRRRCVPRRLPLAPLLLPSAALAGMACTGWYPFSQWHRALAGVDAGKIKVSNAAPGDWQSLRPHANGWRSEDWTFNLSLRATGLPPQIYGALVIAPEMILQPEGGSEFRMRTASTWLHHSPRHEAGIEVNLVLNITAQEAAALSGKACRVTGVLVFRCYEKKPLTVPFDREPHHVTAGELAWRIRVPAPERLAFFRSPYAMREDAGQWVEAEFIGSSLGPNAGGAFRPFAHFPNKLRNRVTGETFPLHGYDPGTRDYLWEGAGYNRQRLVPANTNSDVAGQNYGFLDQLAADPGNATSWDFEFEALVMSGTLEVPLEVQLPADK